MTISERSLKNGERAVFRLRELYGQYGYTYYKMSKFEEYDLYVRSKSFLPSEHIPTFTDTDGKLMALKPDVTLSIVKKAQDGGGALEKVYYNENVYRADSGAHGYREILQAGLECIGQIDLHAMAEVALLAVKSLEAVGGGDCLLNLSHLGVVTGLLEAAGASEPACAALLTAIISTDFTKYFVIFHQIFFDNDLWILDPATDLLINIVPEPFFMDTAGRIALTFGISVGVLFFGCLLWIFAGKDPQKASKKQNPHAYAKCKRDPPGSIHKKRLRNNIDQ